MWRVSRISRQPFYRNLLLSLFFCGIFPGPATAGPPDRWIELGYQWATLNDETGRFLEGGFQLTHWGPVGLGARLNVMLGDVGSPFDLKQGRLNHLWYGGLLLSYEGRWRWVGLSLNTLAGFGFAEQEKRDFDVTGLGEIGLGVLQPGVGLRFSIGRSRNPL